MLDGIVLGLGVMGSAALHRLALAGQRVHGIEQFALDHGRGSSHGGTRVTRKAYFEDARYVPLLERSWTLMREMEAASGETLLVQTGGLYFGPSGSASVLASYAAAKQHGLAHEWLDACAIRARFPMFTPDDDDAGVFEHDAGVLIAPNVIRAQLALARETGATLSANERVTRVELGDGVRVTTDRGAYEAERVVMALGPWSARSIAGLPPLSIPLRVERQVQLWLAPTSHAALFEPDRMPVFLRFEEPHAFYGLPHVHWPGVKVCRHHGGDEASPDALDRALHAGDEAPVRAFVRRFLPAADGAVVRSEVCMYTNTPDEHFVVGVHPANARVLVMAGFSGHGFKLAPAIGELIAELAVRGTTTLDASLFDPGRAW